MEQKILYADRETDIMESEHCALISAGASVVPVGITQFPRDQKLLSMLLY